MFAAHGHMTATKTAKFGLRLSQMQIAILFDDNCYIIFFFSRIIAPLACELVYILIY